MFGRHLPHDLPSWGEIDGKDLGGCYLVILVKAFQNRTVLPDLYREVVL